MTMMNMVTVHDSWIDVNDADGEDNEDEDDDSGENADVDGRSSQLCTQGTSRHQTRGTLLRIESQSVHVYVCMYIYVCVDFFR